MSAACPWTTLRSLIAVVPQHSYLFSGTLAENLRMAAPEATDEDLWRVLDSAQAEEFVRKLPQGLDAPVSQGGTNFSGGQRQRLCIARALLRRGSGVPVRRQLLGAGLRHRLPAPRGDGPLLRTATVLIVAERVATIVDAGPDPGPGRRPAGGAGNPSPAAGHPRRATGRSPRPSWCWRRPCDAVNRRSTPGPSAPAARDAQDQPLVDTPSGGRSQSLPVLSLAEAPKGGRFRWRTAGRLLGLLRPSKWRMVGVIAATCAFVVLNVAAPKLLGDATDVVVEGVVGGSFNQEKLAALLAGGVRHVPGGLRLQLDPGRPDGRRRAAPELRAAGLGGGANCTSCRPAILTSNTAGTC